MGVCMGPRWGALGSSTAVKGRGSLCRTFINNMGCHCEANQNLKRRGNVVCSERGWSSEPADTAEGASVCKASSWASCLVSTLATNAPLVPTSISARQALGKGKRRHSSLRIAAKIELCVICLHVRSHAFKEQLWRRVYSLGSGREQGR